MDQRISQLLKDLEGLTVKQRFQRIEFFAPYPKQVEFFASGARHRERLFLAGNQLGKTEAGAAEMAYHLTGLYPLGWKGRRWERPVRAWAAGPDAVFVRDNQQKKLFGEPGLDEARGTGMVPRHCILECTPSRSATDAFDTVMVQHHDKRGKPDGTSVLRFKSYEQGRKKFQGETLDIIWDDEEPPMDIYSEELTRVTATKGMIYITFTPMLGRSQVVLRFLEEASPDRDTITMTIFDVTHIDPVEREKIIAGYPAHERDARTKGIPMLGSGAIFPYSDDALGESIPPFDRIPEHWAKLWGVDFGIDHPFAAVLMAWDKDSDVLHVLHAFRVSDQLPLQHAAAIKMIAGNVPVAWPHDGHDRDKGSGVPLADAYKKFGLKMLPTHATHPDGSNSTEAGILEMQTRMVTGRFKVASHLSEWFEEKNNYHRKDGLIVKFRDDILSATRIAVMARRHARPVLLGRGATRRREPQFAEGIDFDLFS